MPILTCRCSTTTPQLWNYTLRLCNTSFLMTFLSLSLSCFLGILLVTFTMTVLYLSLFLFSPSFYLRFIRVLLSFGLLRSGA